MRDNAGCIYTELVLTSTVYQRIISSLRICPRGAVSVDGSLVSSAGKQPWKDVNKIVLFQHQGHWRRAYDVAMPGQELHR